MEDGKFVILCVDDDPDILMTMRIVLEENGYKMVDAASAETGLKVFKEAKPDLIIIDLMMEEVDAGTGFVKEMKALGADVPIIMISSAGDNLSLTTDYTQLGLAGLFQKPVDPDVLLMILEQKLKR